MVDSDQLRSDADRADQAADASDDVTRAKREERDNLNAAAERHDEITADRQGAEDRRDDNSD